MIHLPLSHQVARSLDAEPELLPVLANLFEDFGELGSSTAELLEMLLPLGVPPGSHGLDLGCGKGVAAVALARELGLDMLGIDGFGPFVAAARERARAEGVEAHCRFREGDVRVVAGEAGSFDLVLLLGLGPVLGDPVQTMGALRRLVRPGGCIGIDDAYLRGGLGDGALAGFESYRDREQTIRMLTSHGDVLLHESAEPEEAVRTRNEAITARLRARAREIGRRRPDLVPALERFVAAQEHETRVAGADLIYACWLLRRAR